MLVVMRDEKTKALTVVGAMLAAAGLGFLPDSFNVDDGAVAKAEQQAILDHPELDNQAWKNFGILHATKLWVADHPAFSKLHDGDISKVGPDHPLAAAVYEQLHDKPKPAYVDASDPEAARVERAKAAEDKLVTSAAALKHASPDDPTSETHKCAKCGTEWTVKKGGPVDCPECSKGNPSEDDLDEAADEEKAKEATSGAPTTKRKPKPVAGVGAGQN